MPSRNIASNLDLAQSNDTSTPESGFTRIKAKVSGDVVVQMPNGEEKSIVNEAPVTVTKLIIDGGAPNTAPENFVLRFDFGGVE